MGPLLGVGYAQEARGPFGQVLWKSHLGPRMDLVQPVAWELVVRALGLSPSKAEWAPVERVGVMFKEPQGGRPAGAGAGGKVKCFGFV